MFSPKTQTAVLQAAVEGDEDARCVLLSLAAEFLAQFAHRESRNNRDLSWEDVEEVANDTLARVHKAMQEGAYRPFSSTGKHAFHGYVYRVFKHGVIDKVRYNQRKRAIPASELAAGDGMPPEFESREPAPVDELIEREGHEFREFLGAVCFALAIKSIDLVRRRQMAECTDEDDAEQRLLAWRGFVMMVLDGKPRDEVVQRLTKNSKVGENLTACITPAWLSKRATRIRKQLWEAFLTLGSALVPQASRADLHQSLAEMCQKVGYDELATRLRSVCEPDVQLTDDQLASVDRLLADARRQLESNRKLKVLTGKLQTRATRLSHH